MQFEEFLNVHNRCRGSIATFSNLLCKNNAQCRPFCRMVKGSFKIRKYGVEDMELSKM